MRRGMRLTKTRSAATERPARESPVGARGVAKLFALALLSNACGATGPAVHPVSSPVRVDLGPGSLQEALEKLAELAHLQILYNPDILRGLTTPGLHAK